MLKFRFLIFLLLLAAAAMLAAANSYRSNVSFLTPSKQNNSEILKSIQETLPTDIKICNYESAFQYWKNGERVFIDARSSELFNKGHIEGAISFPLIKFDQMIHEIETQIFPQMPLVIYCGGLDCQSSISLATKLNELGYQDIKIFIEGWDLWAKKSKK